MRILLFIAVSLLLFTVLSCNTKEETYRHKVIMKDDGAYVYVECCIGFWCKYSEKMLNGIYDSDSINNYINSEKLRLVELRRKEIELNN